jgi:hypothetical protein
MNKENPKQERKISISVYKLTGYIIGGVLSAILASIVFFVPETSLTIEQRLGIFSVNILFLLATLQFLFDYSFKEHKEELKQVLDEQNNKVDSLSNQLSSSMQDISGIVQLEKINEMILTINNTEEKYQYQELLKNSLLYISDCIKEKRSGELEDMAYYNLLNSASEKILLEKENTSTEYSGEIRALTFCLTEELDMNSLKNGDYERNWLEKMKALDKNGIITKRLWVFDDEKNKLLKQKDKDTEDFLGKKLKLYCVKNTEFSNTESKAISIGTIRDDVEKFRKGFFAIKLIDESSMLIYGVAKEKVRTAKALCGEIDYDDKRRTEILNKWESYWNIAAPLNQYLKENSSDSVIDYMKQLNFKIDD